MDHAWLGSQYLIRGMVLTQQLHEKEIISTMNQKTNKNPRDVHEKENFQNFRTRASFCLLSRLPTQIQEALHFLTVASKMDSTQWMGKHGKTWAVSDLVNMSAACSLQSLKQTDARNAPTHRDWISKSLYSRQLNMYPWQLGGWERTFLNLRPVWTKGLSSRPTK